MNGLMGLTMVGVDPLGLGKGNGHIYPKLAKVNRKLENSLKKNNIDKVYNDYIKNTKENELWVKPVETFEEYLIYKEICTLELKIIFEEYKKEVNSIFKQIIYSNTLF